MGVVPKAKAGIGSAVNDATRLLGSTLGVAVIGSVYASLYNNRLSDRLPAALAPRLARTAHDSVGGALALANRTSVNRPPRTRERRPRRSLQRVLPRLQRRLPRRRGVSAVAAIGALLLLPAHPTTDPTTGLTLALESE